MSGREPKRRKALWRAGKAVLGVLDFLEVAVVVLLLGMCAAI